MTEQPSPLVTVVITCYNYGKYLKEAIKSVLSSTFQSLEIIIVNDGSTDPDTLRVLERLEEPKTRIVHQENKGAAAARNTGVRHALGMYIYSLDADDKIHPTLLAKAVDVLESRSDVGFVSSWRGHFKSGKVARKYPPYNFYTLLFRNIMVSGSMFRKTAWKQVGGYNERMRGYEDWEFWISLGASGWMGYTIREPLFYYRRHRKSKWGKSYAMHNRLIQLIRQKHAQLYTPEKLAELKRIWKPGALQPTRRTRRRRVVRRNRRVNQK